ncbi:hypothetical protein SCATT_p08160 (plasmid) [Streptantibioticus cattleyicolor NRRL 8057 = DSM 46488]|uniref:Uncharacterized protein n=1 Tax=Streptantibioticus cattleyicolor (strain ATCC 35852 / DSM 46488 / JCM 4925 / NBRC 14057 / NRRL 8057) TaxID=1003195 RepID=G8XD63_STREN|nr:hypothetical protein SCATT_p08160 [Streptantibioticus cattleyicolor NRRL 8057 = DSM 46488]
MLKWREDDTATDEPRHAFLTRSTGTSSWWQLTGWTFRRLR